jgi:hypothetical protein
MEIRILRQEILFHKGGDLKVAPTKTTQNGGPPEGGPYIGPAKPRPAELYSTVAANI